MSMRRRAVDLIEHARMEGVHASIRQVGNRFARLLREPDDRPGGVEFHDASGRRVLRVEHRQGRDRTVFPMSVDE